VGSRKRDRPPLSWPDPSACYSPGQGARLTWSLELASNARGDRVRTFKVFDQTGSLPPSLSLRHEAQTGGHDAGHSPSFGRVGIPLRHERAHPE
jgi:hypothetical protein